jgi:hypothetical protein
VRVLLRWLGVVLLASAAARWPSSVGRVVSAVALVVANLLPVWGVLEGTLSVGDVFLVYWYENLVIWGCTTVKLRTVEDGRSHSMATMNGALMPPKFDATFFALHYGIFTAVHGVFSILIAVFAGVSGSWWALALTMAAITASHLVSLAVNWFGNDERLHTRAGVVMFVPYPRMIVLHVGVILGFMFALGGSEAFGGEWDGEVLSVAVLCGLKTLVDLGLHLTERWIYARGATGTPGSGVTMDLTT